MLAMHPPITIVVPMPTDSDKRPAKTEATGSKVNVMKRDVD